MTPDLQTISGEHAPGVAVRKRSGASPAADGNEPIKVTPGTGTYSGDDGDDLFVLGTEMEDGPRDFSGNSVHGGTGEDMILVHGVVTMPGSLTGIEHLTFGTWSGGVNPQANFLTSRHGDALGSLNLLGQNYGDVVIRMDDRAEFDASGITREAALVGGQYFDGADTVRLVILAAPDVDSTMTGSQGRDVLEGNSGDDTLYGLDGDDNLKGGSGLNTLYGGLGDDLYLVNVTTDVIVEYADEGTDTVFALVSYALPDHTESLILYPGQGDLNGWGNDLDNILEGNEARNLLTGHGGDDTIRGGADVDVAAFAGDLADYTITQTETGVFEISGPDGTDTLYGIEYAQFDDQTMRLLPGEGVTVNFDTAAPSVYQSAMEAIRDFDGNDLGGDGNWLRIGSADIDGDGDVDQILVNDAIGRFATVGTADDGLIHFDDYSWAGETRVAGIYVDPLVALGWWEPGSENDSQQRFSNDLQIENINRVLGAGDYDGDGLQEVYLALTDNTAYLHLYMHEDGNIRYANYQSQEQVVDYLSDNGFTSATWGEWFA